MKLIHKIIIPLVVFILFLVLFIGLYVQGSLRGALFQNEFFTMQESVASQAATHLVPTDFSDPQSNEAKKHLANFTEGISDSTTARVTVWNNDEQIIYSDLTSIIGSRAFGRIGLKDFFVRGSDLPCPGHGQ